MAKNDFKPFATGAGANVMPQADWEALPALLSGFTTGKASSAQVNKAIRQAAFISSAVAQFVSDSLMQDILDDGNSQDFVVKLKQSIVNGSVPAGIPMPWPASTPPTGWLKCNGASFNTAIYPLLAKAYPSGVLPDLRGEFIRGWDDGRGVDSGRGVLSTQLDALQKMTGTASNGANTGFINNVTSIVTGVFKRGTATYGNTTAQDANYQGVDLFFDSSLVARSATETRPRNVAFNYIVRAA